MSFIILAVIIVLLYATFAKYGSVLKAFSVSLFITGLTLAFMLYGLTVFENNSVFTLLNTEMNMAVFVHACIVWFIADILVIYKIARNYRLYLSVNAEPVNRAEQEPV
jgi:hypothetical protein